MKRYLWVIILLVFFLTPGLRADDTDIYGTTTISVTPNVLIIFDTSGSMSTRDIPGDYYDPGQTYTLTYHPFTNNAVYVQSQNYYNTNRGYVVFANDINDLNCPAVKTALQNDGHVRDYIKNQWGNFECDGNKRSLYMGNYLNYDFSGGGTLKTRNEVAREVIKNLIAETNNVNFGLMRFNNDEGGRLIATCGTDKATLINTVDGLPAEDWTPLAETLAEAGLYFAGKKSWFDGSNGRYSSDCDDHGNGCYQYESPMTVRCQKNYIIIMTDGEPTYDKNAKLATGTYINGDHIGDYDHDGRDPGYYADNGSDYLDDVAKYLYDNDLNPNLGTTGESFEKQNVTTYTIGFTTQQDLLSRTAQNGGGLYYTANSISGLSDAFHEILADIADVSAVFVSPVVPVSRMNRTYAGNSLYVGFFKPQSDGRWDGNIKKYGLSDQGIIVDADGNPATLDNGSIKDNARSYWSDTPDGADVLSGGIGGLLLDQGTRHLYTYMGQSVNLADPTNSFSIANTDYVTDGSLDVGTGQRSSVINDIYGVGRGWVLGDILHSRPAVVHYDTDHNGTLDESVIYTGGNDGMMHCFKDSDGSEVWGFVPPDLLPRLKELSDGTTTHKYFVDGVPKVYEDSSHKILFFGERRGGNHYYALNVTTYDSPSFAYQIGSLFLTTEDGDHDGILDGDHAILGQSWSEPTVQKISTSIGTDPETVFLLAGGYDANQDLPPYDPVNPDAPYRGDDTVGRAVFTVNVLTGAIGKLNVNAGNYSDMTHSIVDVAGFDANGNGITNRVYAGDLGGNIFAFEDDNGDGNWSRRKLFSASAVDNVQRKIFYAPDAVEETYGEVIFFGTGDRADPEGTGVTNRIYAIKNHWGDVDGFTTLTESDLYNATEDLIVLGTASQQSAAREALANQDGWFIELNVNAGEKVTSPMTVFNGVLYFTTYTPESSSTSPEDGDVCEEVSGRGQARLYALNYKTGEAAFEWSNLAETDHTDDHNTVNKGRWDRSKIIGTSIASAPVVAILQGGPQIYTGVEGGVQRQDPQVTQNMETFFWRQLNN
ncbi:MAG: PilC/PilY family type IV pilus protein [Desulfobacterales bacterium]